jgi:hypothetical protein
MALPFWQSHFSIQAEKNYEVNKNHTCTFFVFHLYGRCIILRHCQAKAQQRSTQRMVQELKQSASSQNNQSRTQ